MVYKAPSEVVLEIQCQHCGIACFPSITSCLWGLSKCFLNPSSVLTSHSLRSITSFFPDTFSIMIRALSEFRILQTVEVDSRFLPLKSLFSKILFINVDFPALVSPAKKKRKQLYSSYFLLMNLHILFKSNYLLDFNSHINVKDHNSNQWDFPHHVLIFTFLHILNNNYH